jgi:hypothetical protein
MKKITFLFTVCIITSVSLFAQPKTFTKTFASSGSILWDYAEPASSGYRYVGTLDSNLIWAKTDTGGNITTCNEYKAPFKFITQSESVGISPTQPGIPHTMLVASSPGNYILVACLYGGNAVGLIKINSTGGVSWTNKYTIPSLSKFTLNSLSLSNSGKYGWIAGYGNVGKVKTGVIIEVDSSGNIAQSKSLVVDSTVNNAGSFYQMGGLVEGKDNNCYITVTTASVNFMGYGPNNGLLIKTDSLLNSKWSKGGPMGTSSMAINGNAIYTLQFYIDYSTPPNFPRYNEIEIFDTSGKEITVRLSPESQAGCTQIQATKDGGFITYGARSDGWFQGTVIKFNDSATVQWANYYDINARDMEQINSIMPDANGGYIMTGNASTNTVYNLLEGYVLKADSMGNNTCINTAFSYSATGAGPNTTSGRDSVIISALTVNDSSLTAKLTTIIDSEGVDCINGIPTSVNSIDKAQQSVILFPNPNHGQFTIESSVVSGQSLVEVYNMFGERVFTQYSLPGSQCQLNLSNQPAGIYLYRIINADSKSIATGKFVIE